MNDRDTNGRLTRWKTGRRFVYIQVPDSPLARSVRIRQFSTKLFHREQNNILRRAIGECYNCLEISHFSRECPKDVKCRTCKLPGHIAGDESCTVTAR